MPYPKKKYARRKAYKRKSTRKVGKPLRAAIKQVVNANVETKTINVPDYLSLGLTNTLNRPYGALDGLAILAGDIFKVSQGVTDSSALLAANRIGDRIRGVGFLMDYYFSTRSWYTLGGLTFYIPYIKLRIVAWRQVQATGQLTQALLCNGDFVQGNTSTLQPINWDEGFVKDVLYDQVHIIRNPQFTSFTQTGCIPSGQLPVSNVFHFKKYIKFDHVINFLDNQSPPANSTDKPINIGIFAELDDAATGLVPSSQPILYTTGYTRCWFKDG